MPPRVASRDLARSVLTLGASRAYRCGAALRPPLEGGDAALTWALRLGALAMVSGQTDVYADWWQKRDGIAASVERYAGQLDHAGVGAVRTRHPLAGLAWPAGGAAQRPDQRRGRGAGSPARGHPHAAGRVP